MKIRTGAEEVVVLQTPRVQTMIWFAIKKHGISMDKWVIIRLLPVRLSNNIANSFLMISRVLDTWFSLSFFKVVKRGCIRKNADINGRKSDGEGCEEILRDSKETYFQQIICMCPTDLCNEAPILSINPMSSNTNFLYLGLFLILSML